MLEEDSSRKSAENKVKLQKAERRRARAQEALAKTNSRIIRLAVAQSLEHNPERGPLLAREKELRSEIHRLRAGATKKRSSLMRLLHISVKLSEDVETLRALEGAAIIELDQVRKRMDEMRLMATESVVGPDLRTLAPQSLKQ